jgi:hypothetical protein
MLILKQWEIFKEMLLNKIKLKKIRFHNINVDVTSAWRKYRGGEERLRRLLMNYSLISWEKGWCWAGSLRDDWSLPIKSKLVFVKRDLGQTNAAARHFNEWPISELHGAVDTIQTSLKLLYTSRQQWNVVSAFQLWEGGYSNLRLNSKRQWGGKGWVLTIDIFWSMWVNPMPELTLTPHSIAGFNSCKRAKNLGTVVLLK